MVMGKNLPCLQGKERWRELVIQKLGLDGGNIQVFLSPMERKGSVWHHQQFLALFKQGVRPLLAPRTEHFSSKNFQQNANTQDANAKQSQEVLRRCGESLMGKVLSSQFEDHHCCSSTGPRSLKPGRKVRGSHPPPWLTARQHQLWEGGVMQ